MPRRDKRRVRPVVTLTGIGRRTRVSVCGRKEKQEEGRRDPVGGKCLSVGDKGETTFPRAMKRREGGKLPLYLSLTVKTVLGFLPSGLGVERGVRPEDDGGWTRGKGVRSQEGSFGIHAASSLFLAPARARALPLPHTLTHHALAHRRPSLPPSLLGSTAGHINPSPSLPSCRNEEVAVPQQPYQNHSSCYLPSFLFLPWLVLHVWHLAVSRPLSGGLRLDGDPFLTWDATTRYRLIAVPPTPTPLFASPAKYAARSRGRRRTMMGCRDRRGTRGVR